MNKMVQEGMVAVVYSPHDCWSTKYGYEELAVDPELVKLVSRKNSIEVDETYKSEIANEIVDYCNQRYGVSFDLDTATDLIVEWVPKGSYYKIQNTPVGGEYLMQKVEWSVA